MSSAEPAFVFLPGDERLTTAILSDSMDAAGLRHQVLEDRLAPVTAGLRCLGRATTMRFEPSEVVDPDDPYAAAIDFIDGVSAGQVVIISTDSSNASGFWGELFSAAAIGARAAGVVTDGNLRDTDKIIGLGFPAFSRSRRPIDYRGRMQVTATDVEVTVGGVSICPGDLVMADDDGVVVIPRAHEERVLALARERAGRESTVLTELLAGDSLRAVWDKHKVL